MLSPDECKEKLKDRTLAVVAENTGLHYNTLLRLRDGHAKEPSYKVIKTLSEYFES